MEASKASFPFLGHHKHRWLQVDDSPVTCVQEKGQNIHSLLRVMMDVQREKENHLG